MSELISRFRSQYLRTKKSLGQHFLTNNHFVQEIAKSAVNFAPVLEIGPGCGVLTFELSKLTGDLTVIDIDDNAVEFLQNNKDEFFKDLKIIHGDFLSLDLYELFKGGKVSVVGNLPYNISVKILEHCTKYIDMIENMVFMFQKEVASRISASAGSKDYSSLSVFSDYYFHISKIRDISGSNFWPNANVMSSVLKFVPKDASERLPSTDEEKFFNMLRDAFKQKRKTLFNNLKSYPNIMDALHALNLNSTVRAEQLTLYDFRRIYELIEL